MHALQWIEEWRDETLGAAAYLRQVRSRSRISGTELTRSIVDLRESAGKLLSAYEALEWTVPTERCEQLSSLRNSVRDFLDTNPAHDCHPDNVALLRDALQRAMINPEVPGK